MKSMKNISIKKKLIALQLITTLVVLIFYTTFLVFRDSYIMKNTISTRLTSLARFIGANCKSPLNFLDNGAADELLSSLDAEKHVVNAWIYDARGKLFSKYSKEGYTNFAFPKLEEAGKMIGGYFTFTQPIVQEGETIGLVSLRYDIGEYRKGFRYNIFIAILVLLVVLVAAFLLYIITQKTISHPITNLAETVKTVSETGNYLLRVKKERNDEVGILYDGFNSMMDQIQYRELEREKADTSLLQRVREITILNSLSQHVSADLSVEQVVQATIAGICESLEPDLAIFFLREGDQLVVKNTGPPHSPYLLEIFPPLLIGECLCGRAASLGKPLYSINIEKDKRCDRNECQKAGLRSIAALPLRGRDEIIGVLVLASGSTRDFRKQKTFLETLTNAIAIGLQNAILFEKISQYSAGLETRVTERTRELSEANIKLKELDQLKSMFLASMSHELRTPLNSIIGFTGLLLMGMAGALNQEQRKQLNMVKSSANHLLSLINDVLDISKIESGKISLYIESFGVTEVVDEVLSAVLPAAAEKGLEIIKEINDNITIASDKRRTKQILMNLVSNAIKFTDHGTITITVKVVPDQQVEITVTDTGIGIKSGDMEKLFEPFQQIDMSASKKHEGTGLGLYLCKKLVALLQGSIASSSQYEKGSEFSFRLPFLIKGKEGQEQNR